ncbi:MAG: carboxymuconolactone decarboxylase family protein [Candidatus Omnitrophica bacterium]|nr:carboxymuconolactone decarboxylase family protein [Candidatus Omnitrophota bacterium]
MSRIQPIDPEKAQGKPRELLAAIKAKSGRVPNILKTMAHSSVALQAYMGLSGAFADAKLPPQIREQIALAVGEDNQCHYCVAAHSAIGKLSGLTPEEIEAGRRAKSGDPKTDAILKFAKRLSANRGNVTDPELAEARKAGCSDDEILEIVRAVALNIFTNYVNHVADTAIDFPQVSPLI